MAFNSFPFILFFITVWIAFCCVRPNYKIAVLLISSVIFYGVQSIFSLIFLASIILVCYLFALRGNRTLIQIGSLFIVSILVTAKWILPKTTYENDWAAIVFPLGLSFYALQAYAYLSDLATGKIGRPASLPRLALFLSFFPQATLGPIHRYKELDPQFEKVGENEIWRIPTTLKIILYGFFCKLILADKISLLIGPILDNPENENGVVILLSGMLYSYQIYFDFYGYTLIATGIAYLFGIRLVKNFNRPYSVKSFQLFWRRWHMSLSKWLRDYVYLRLGGRSSAFWRFSIVILITFLASAVWHGTTFNYFIWGCFHAFLYLLEIALRKIGWMVGIGRNIIVDVFQRIGFFVTMTLTWLIFRTTDLQQLSIIFKKILYVPGWTITAVPTLATNIYFIFVIGLIIILVFKLDKRANLIASRSSISIRERGEEFLYISFLLLSIVVFGGLEAQEFLYFKF